MEQPLLLQSGQFLWSVALGAALGIVYDLLRGLRRNLRGLTHLLDFIFSLTVLLSGLCLALFIGGGQYRLFMPIGTALGAAIYFLTLSRLLARWSCAFWRFFTYPLRALGRYFKKICKKLQKISKNIFSIGKKSDKIKGHKRNSREARKYAAAKKPSDRHTRHIGSRTVCHRDDRRTPAEDQPSARRR